MRMRMLMICAFMLLMSTAVFAQEAAEQATGDVVVTDLYFPRGIEFDAETNLLYVAVSGMGGDVTLLDDPESGMTITGGLSGSVTLVSLDGSAMPLVYFPSAMSPEGGLGVYRVYPQGESLWVVLSDVMGILPFGPAVVELDAETHRLLNYIDLYAFEAANNPDSTDEINSNPGDIAWSPEGLLYILDTGANALYTWTAEEGLALFHAWGNDVPTAIDFDANGDLYVGFLGEGFAPGAAKVERWSDGELAETFAGYTAITDITVAEDGTVYAVQMFQFGEQGPVPASGTVVSVDADGGTVVAEGLSTPFGIAYGDGALYVTTESAAFGPLAAGSVVRIPLS